MDISEAQALARHMKRQMQEKKKSIEELLTEYAGSISPEYSACLILLIKEAEAVLKCPIQDF